MAVGEEIDLTLINVGGGRNGGQSPAALADNEWFDLDNMLVFGTHIEQRGGLTKVTEVAFNEDLSSLFAMKLSAGTWLLLVGTATGVAKKDGTGLVALPITDGQVYVASAEPWYFRQYQDEVLAVRKGTGTLKRVTQDLIQDAGIAAPVTAPTLAEGGAGNIAAGNYIGVVVFGNRHTGARSNPSPPSNVLTLGANKRRDWSNIAISPNGQVNMRELYITPAGQTGEYYFAHRIEDNFTTAVSENVIQDDLGDAASFENGLPPTGVAGIEIWQERGWLHDETHVYFSQRFNPQGYDPLDVVQLDPDDGHKIKGLLAWNDRLAVGKTNSMWFLSPSGESGKYPPSKLSDVHGCASGQSMKTAEGLLFWLAPDRNVYQSDGVEVKSISTVKIRDILDAIPDTSLERCVGAVYPTRSLYVLTIHRNDEVGRLHALAYNYKSETWMPVSHVAPGGSSASWFLGDFFDADGEQRLYAVLAGRIVYEWNSAANTDDGAPIRRRGISKAFDLGQPPYRKGIRTVSLLGAGIPDSITLRLYHDLATTPVAERTVLLPGTTGWKRYGLSSVGRPGALIQFGFEYSGPQRLRIDGFGMNGVLFKRRVKVA